MIKILHTGDCLDILATMPNESVDCCVTSPPYFGLRDYGVEGQIGLEASPEEYVNRLVAVFREVRRVLVSDGTLWLNLGDSYFNHSPVRSSSTGAFETEYTGGKISEGSTKRRRANGHPTLKMKDLIGIPWMVAFALRADGWYLRQDIIWHKPNPMPESIKDRCTKAHEYIFLLSKQPKYFYNFDGIKEPAINPNEKRRPVGSPGAWKLDGRAPRENGGGSPYDHDSSHRNKRSVWSVATRHFKGAHFATFPPDLIRPCILAGCPENGIVLDPFAGASTTGVVALEEMRSFVGIELNPEYVKISEDRLKPIVELSYLSDFDGAAVA